MNDRSVLLTGLDGTNPLGFLAALGTLRILHERALAAEEALPRLSWEDDGRWRPRIWGISDIDTIIAAILEDLQTWKSEPALELAYDEEGNLVTSTRKASLHVLENNGNKNDESGQEIDVTQRKRKKREANNKEEDKIKRDLKPKPEALRIFLLNLVESCRERPERSLAVAAAYGTEIAIDNNGNVKPTAFHFTAGKQMFLSMVRDLRDGIQHEDLEEALVGPWENQSTLPSLSWDASAPRIYALRATDPSTEKRGSVPAANWLAFVALQFFPVAPIGSQVVTPCILGGWKGARFRWPLWHVGLTSDTVASLLRTGWFAGDGIARSMYGIAIVMESVITRSDHYGVFSPASALC